MCKAAPLTLFLRMAATGCARTIFGSGIQHRCCLFGYASVGEERRAFHDVLRDQRPLLPRFRIAFSDYSSAMSEYYPAFYI